MRACLCCAASEKSSGLPRAFRLCIRRPAQAPSASSTRLRRCVGWDVCDAACYEDADDCDWLRDYPIFKMAVGPASGELATFVLRLPCRGWRCAVEGRIARLMAALVDGSCESYRRARPDHARHRRYCDRCTAITALAFNAPFTNDSLLSADSTSRWRQAQTGGVILREGRTPGPAKRSARSSSSHPTHPAWPLGRKIHPGGAQPVLPRRGMEWCEETQGVD